MVFLLDGTREGGEETVGRVHTKQTAAKAVLGGVNGGGKGEVGTVLAGCHVIRSKRRRRKGRW